jgi:hypothetical protein
MPDEHQPRRPWIWLWTQEYIHGSTRFELEPDERSVWTDFMALAGDSPVLGSICVSEKVPYTDQQLANVLNISTELLQRAKRKMLEYGKIRINGTGSIELINFWKYQPAFDRTGYQRKYMQNYRKQKKTQKGKGKDSKTNS